MTMLERIAEVMADNAGDGRDYSGVAAQVLEEMREPTAEMLDAASKADGAYAEDTAPAGVHWRAMIDAALAS